MEVEVIEKKNTVIMKLNELTMEPEVRETIANELSTTTTTAVHRFTIKMTTKITKGEEKYAGRCSQYPIGKK